jgi:GxxExxY protein
LIADKKVIIELKAVRALDSAHEAQLINYLKARPPRLSDSRWRAGNKY